MTSADLRAAEPRLSAPPARRSRSGGVVWLAVVICCAVIGLDQVLHTTPAALAAAPSAQAAHWVGDVILAVPFAAVALWVSGWLGSRLGIRLTSRWDVFAQACLVTLLLAVLLVPAWFGHYAVDSVAPAPTVQAAAAHAGHAGHEHGATPPPAASWVGTGVLYLLMSIPLAAAAVCVGQRVARKLMGRLGETDVVVRVAVSIGAVALALGLGWFLQGVASQSNTLLTYRSAFVVVHEHHHAHAHIATVTEAVVQPPFGFQLATAAQDGLAGQAIGLPVTFAGLLWLTRRLRNGSLSAPNKGTNAEEGPTRWTNP
jgi:hypothetical protein